jgi:uncharacterized protein YeaO (DUF488 family)
MLRTKCIFDPVSTEDGLRISVMSRHTLEDGITPDKRIIPGVSYMEHHVELAPPSTTVGKWYRSSKSETDWDIFTEEYLGHLDKPKQAREVRWLAKFALRRDVTILCVEPRGERCHRVILSEMCKQMQPALEVRHV